MTCQLTGDHCSPAFGFVFSKLALNYHNCERCDLGVIADSYLHIDNNKVAEANLILKRFVSRDVVTLLRALKLTSGFSLNMLVVRGRIDTAILSSESNMFNANSRSVSQNLRTLGMVADYSCVEYRKS